MKPACCLVKVLSATRVCTLPKKICEGCRSTPLHHSKINLMEKCTLGVFKAENTPLIHWTFIMWPTGVCIIVTEGGLSYFHWIPHMKSWFIVWIICNIHNNKWTQWAENVATTTDRPPPQHSVTLTYGRWPLRVEEGWEVLGIWFEQQEGISQREGINQLSLYVYNDSWWICPLWVVQSCLLDCLFVFYCWY